MLGVIDHTTVRAPLLSIGDDERAIIQRALEQAGLL
jgi:dihydrodipicolinate synthase/N-acetylneuraminate lyase